MQEELRRIDEQGWFKLPFGYYVEPHPDLLTLHRCDGSCVRAFSARDVDPLEVELTVWEDAD